MISTTQRRAMGLSDEKVSSSSPVCTAAIEELAKGLESVARLGALCLLDPSENCRFDASKAAGLLIEEIMETLSKAMAVLESGKKHDEQMAAPVDSPSPVVTSKGNGGKRKMHSTRKSVNRMRGHPYSWTRVTSATTEDGCTWRKYGQKEIFSSKHPRSYYRCSHKYDRGCTATRQVQKSEDNPSLYVITYFGEHTCEREANNISTCREPCVINIEPSTTSGIKQETPFSSFPSYKQESEEEVHSTLTCSDSLSDYFVSAEVELQETSMVELETFQSESTSGSQSSITNNELNFMDLEDLWSFDHNELFQ